MRSAAPACTWASIRSAAPACITGRRLPSSYRLDLTVVSDEVDPQFAFMTVDWDGKIRMDPSSKYAMQRLIGLKDKYDVAFACDTDHDRHGVVTRSGGLMEPNHYLSVLIDYLFRHRPQWSKDAAVGKTVVSTALIDRVVSRLGRKLYEVPVGFKWFAEGLFDGSLGFGCEESAGASLLRRDGSVWTTDKDGLVPALLSAEITARAGRDPGALYDKLTGDLGKPFSNRVEATATPAQKAKLARLSPDAVENRPACRREDRARAGQGAGQRRSRSAASRRSRPVAGSPPVRPARRRSTRSMRRASRTKSICTACSTRRKRSSTPRLRKPGMPPVR